MNALSRSLLIFALPISRHTYKKTSGNTAEEGISPRPCGVTVICMLRDWRL